MGFRLPRTHDRQSSRVASLLEVWCEAGRSPAGASTVRGGRSPPAPQEASVAGSPGSEGRKSGPPVQGPCSRLRFERMPFLVYRGLRLGRLLLEEALEETAPDGVLELLQGADLDLPYPLPRHLELLSELLERVGVLAAAAESHLRAHSLPETQGLEDVLDLRAKHLLCERCRG